MSIQTELVRIENAKADIITAIEGKGVYVPEGAKLDDMATMINDISQTGGGSGDNSVLEGRVSKLETKVKNMTEDIATLQAEMDELYNFVTEMFYHGYYSVSPNGTAYKIRVRDDGTLYTELLE